MSRTLLASFVLLVAACDTVSMWFAPNTTCAEWRHLNDDQRSTIVEQVIRGVSTLEAVRAAQHAPAGTPENQLVSMAVASVTKNCEVQRWSPAALVKDIVRALYDAGPGT